MPFNRSLLHPLPYRPYRTDAQGNVVQTLDGVFILFSRPLAEWMKENLTQAQKDEIEGWIYQVTEAQAAIWHVPVWAGRNAGFYLRVPAALWNDPAVAPPQKVKDYLRTLWSEAS